MVPRKIFFSPKFNVTQLLYYGLHHTWRMPEIQDCNVTFCESFAKVPRELRESWGWDLEGGAHSFSQLPHFHTYSLPLSLSLTLTLSNFHLTLSLSLSLCLPHSPPLSLFLTLSLLLSVCLYLSLSLFLFLLLNELVIRIMHGDGSAKVLPKDFCSREVGHFGNKEFRTTPTYTYGHIYIYIYIYTCIHVCVHLSIYLSIHPSIRRLPDTTTGLRARRSCSESNIRSHRSQAASVLLDLVSTRPTHPTSEPTDRQVWGLVHLMLNLCFVRSASTPCVRCLCGLWRHFRCSHPRSTSVGA